MKSKLSPQEFEMEFGPLHRAIFAGKALLDQPFCSPRWRTLLVPYGNNMKNESFDALVEAASKCGDQEIIIMDAETIEPTEAAVIISLSREDYEATILRPGTNLGVMDTHLFGRSGRWGCICAPSLDGIAILGGDSAFVATFTDSAGGEQTLRDQFLEFSSSEWSVDADVRLKLLRMVGW
jgi:hypothetical protein